MPLSLFALLLPLRTALRCTVVTLLVAMGLSPALAHASLQLKLGHAPTAVTDTVVTPRVHAQLVAWAPQGVAPGRPFELGLRLVHSDGWHTYWKNAGDSGLPTAFNWQLPAGMRTDAVDWPTPQQIRVGDLLNYGYEGTVLLPVATQISPAFTTDADGQVQIGLHATWLVCRVECIPEEGEFQLRLPADVPHTGWASEFDRAHAQAPVALPQADARVTVHESGERIALRVAGLPAAAQIG
jgi:DsbC/DsbD-like thiol-disulfide interchange protein